MRPLRHTGRAPTAGEWAAFAARQPTGLIWAVVTTAICCRDGCPARRPLPGNVRVFDDRAAAQAAGFRACKRCWRGADDPAATPD